MAIRAPERIPVRHAVNSTHQAPAQPRRRGEMTCTVRIWTRLHVTAKIHRLAQSCVAGVIRGKNRRNVDDEAIGSIIDVGQEAERISWPVLRTGPTAKNPSAVGRDLQRQPRYLWFEPMPGSHTFCFSKLEALFPVIVRILYEAFCA